MPHKARLDFTASERTSLTGACQSLLKSGCETDKLKRKLISRSERIK